MRSIILITGLMLAAGPLSSSALAQEVVSRDSVGASAAATWLALVDAGQYETSWNEAAPLFRENVTSQQWEGAARQVADQVGSLTSRAVSQVTHTTSVPNLPSGDYLIIEFRSAFERLPEALERVALMNLGDSDWRVIGYFVVPG